MLYVRLSHRSTPPVLGWLMRETCSFNEHRIIYITDPLSFSRVLMLHSGNLTSWSHMKNVLHKKTQM